MTDSSRPVNTPASSDSPSLRNCPPSFYPSPFMERVRRPRRGEVKGRGRGLGSGSDRGLGSSGSPGFTLIEVMIAVGILGIAMLALLSLHHTNLQSVIRGQELSRAAMLAQSIMTEAEMQRFPPVGKMNGKFDKDFPNFRWEREVQGSGMFPDVRKVQVTIFYGTRFRSSFSVMEFLHSPEPQQINSQEAAPTEAEPGPSTGEAE